VQRYGCSFTFEPARNAAGRDVRQAGGRPCLRVPAEIAVQAAL